MKVFLQHLFALLQYPLPHHLLSRLIGWLAQSTWGPFKHGFIVLFIRIFKVDMSEALEENPRHYTNFNEFFIRPLKPNARPLCDAVEAIACPADGQVCEAGDIEAGRLLQAKGRLFSLGELLGGDDYLTQAFMGGKFATVYLSPKDYHRVHMPLDGELKTMVHIPGRLFSVNNATAATVPNLFARNERVVCYFDTNAGPMAVILVGAMIVASIETTWHGEVTPVKREVRTIQYPNTTEGVALRKGEEMGLFKLGSTAIVLFGPDMAEWNEQLRAGAKVKMGEKIGELVNM